ncbi:MAG: tetratricopeptide repeat protein [Gemmataceae bacterium]|nr:tetratricopeptide repeat protein [Gemmataceae bacterium]
MQRQLNVRALLWSVGCLAALAVGVSALHGFQLRRNAHHLFERAEQALARNEFKEGLSYLRQYLTLAPGDLAALEQFALTLDKTARDAAEKTRVVLRLEDVLTRDPARHEARERLIHNLIALSRHRDAILHLRLLLPHSARQAELHELLGHCHAAVADPDAAVTALTGAVQLDPQRISSYQALADLLVRQSRDDEAGKVMDQMVEANAKNPEAHLARSRLARQRGRWTEAAKDIEQAAALAPDNAEVLLAAAAWAQAQAKSQVARAHLQRALSAHPDNAVVIGALANLELREGRTADATRILREGTKRVPDAHALQVQLADLLIDAKEIDEATRIVAGLPRTGLSPALANYLRARLAIERREWTAATALLEEACAELGMHSDRSSRAHALLGACYEQTGSIEQRVSAWQRAVQSEPDWIAARLGLGLALLAAERPEEAALQLDAVSKAKDAPSAVWAALARAQLQSTRRRSPSIRNWQAVEHALDRAAANAGDAAGRADLTVLRADMLVARGALAEARKLLVDSLLTTKQVVLWAALANLDAHEGRIGQGLRRLDEADKAFGEQPEIRLARVRLHGTRGNAADRAALHALGQGLDRVPHDAKIVLWRVLADAWRLLGEPEAAEQCWRQLAAAQPTDLRSRFALLESTLQRRDLATARALIAELRRLEGEDGSRWRWGEAALQIHEARGTPHDLAKARRQLAQLGRRHRDWPRVPLLEARIDEIEGKWEGVIENYLKAVELGERQPHVVRPLVQLLRERRMFAEVGQTLALCEDSGPLPKDLARHAAEAAAVHGNAPRVRQLLAQLFPTPPRDYRDLIWRAGLHGRLDEPATAEAYLRQAAQLANHVPDSWIALVERLAKTGQREEASAVIGQMEKTMPAGRLPYTLARCWDAAGDPARAAAAYQEALARQPRDVALLAAAADYHWRAERPDLAAPLYERLLDPQTAAPPDVVAPARRQLALCRAAGGHISQALATLDGGESVADRRVRSFLEGQAPAQTRQAIQQLQESFARHPSRAEEELLLVQLHLAASDPLRARERLANLLIAEETPLVIAWHVRLLVRTEAVQEAALWFAKLERWEPASPRTQELKQLILKAS